MCCRSHVGVVILLACFASSFGGLSDTQNGADGTVLESCAESSSCSFGENTSADDDGSSLLQRRDVSSRRPQQEMSEVASEKKVWPKINTKGDPRIAIAFEGGGFLSLSDFTGLFMGLLHRMSLWSTSRTLSTLLKKFGVITGISGGSWFLSQLIYSSDFQSMINLGARLPSFSRWIFDTKYFLPALDPFMKSTNGTIASGLLQCIKKLKPLLNSLNKSGVGESESTGPPSTATSMPGYFVPWYWEMLGEFFILIRSGQISWLDLVQKLFLKGAGIEPTLPLGTTQHNSWAKDTLFITITTAIAPKGHDTLGNNFDDKDVALYTSHSIEYTYSAGRHLMEHIKSNILPAKWSVIVGAGEEQQSPLPFCSAASCNMYTPNYEYNNQVVVKNANFTQFWQNAFEASAGKVSVSSSSASSSAFLGLSALELSLGAKQGCLELAAWTTGAKDGASFVEANELRTRMFTGDINENIALEASNAGLQPLVDGGVNDILGIANAVIAGATEVLSIGDVDIQFGVSNDGLAWYFEGSPHAGRVIFQSPTYEEVTAMYKDLTRIYAAPGSKFFRALAFGSIACITKENPLFGIPANLNITLNVLAVETVNLTIGLIQSNYSYDSFFNYAQSVGEMTKTMAMKENAEAVQDILDSFFL